MGADYSVKQVLNIEVSYGITNVHMLITRWYSHRAVLECRKTKVTTDSKNKAMNQ